MAGLEAGHDMGGESRQRRIASFTAKCPEFLPMGRKLQ
jgi:hypothetical protein